MLLCRRSAVILTSRARRIISFREFTQLVKPHDHKAKDHAWTGTAYTTIYEQEQLVDLLQGLSQQIDRIHVTNSFARLTILLTPELAQYITNDVLPTTILRGETPQSLDVITAIVDSLPSHEHDEQASTGMTFMLQTGTEPLPMLSRGLVRNGTQHPGYIDFRQKPDKCFPRTCDVRLPLAQTIFSTGKISTLSHTKYASKDGNGLDLESCNDLEWQTIDVPFQPSINMRLNLTPLTAFRSVHKCVGNIVRTLYRDESHTGTPTGSNHQQPASQELEAAISLYFKTRQIEPQSIGVWALIAPSFTDHRCLGLPQDHASTLLNLNTAQICSQWHSVTDSPTQQKHDMSKAITAILQHGGRICRVLSGGGGWGKKAGLLSLDPDIRYTTRELRQDDGWEFDFISESDQFLKSPPVFSEHFGQVVKQGEQIMFLTPADATTTNDQSEPGQSRIVFGTSGSCVSEIPRTGCGGKQESTPCSNASIHPGQFGAMSRLGLSLKWNWPLQGIAETKLDIPLSTIEFRRGT